MTRDPWLDALNQSAVEAYYRNAMETTYRNAGRTDFRKETIFQYKEWSLHAFADSEGVLGVFWGDHEPCGTAIQGIEGYRLCGNCGLRMPKETEVVLADTIRMLNDTLVVKLKDIINDSTIIGQAYPIVKKDHV